MRIETYPECKSLKLLMSKIPPGREFLASHYERMANILWDNGNGPRRCFVFARSAVPGQYPDFIEALKLLPAADEDAARACGLGYNVRLWSFHDLADAKQLIRFLATMRISFEYWLFGLVSQRAPADEIRLRGVTNRIEPFPDVATLQWWTEKLRVRAWELFSQFEDKTNLSVLFLTKDIGAKAKSVRDCGPFLLILDRERTVPGEEESNPCHKGVDTRGEIDLTGNSCYWVLFKDPEEAQKRYLRALKVGIGCVWDFAYNPAALALPVRGKAAA